ncbi:MAG: PAS domain S-box protein [Proteobacteria bacterium]|nr:PAS domain S-box protein [Pseudomonadota bacterium]MBU4470843.1 PAS domain S-box protein [Pseudomonadota bacterium]MCG2753763.1 PAS domain S-box protein [Desulfobacteraceae bacterium]
MIKKFIATLTITIVALVTGAVTLLSTGVYFYFTHRLQAEFNQNMEAHKGRIEIMLENRINEIKSLTEVISTDNTIRFTAQKAIYGELEERLSYFSNSHSSVYIYILDKDNRLICPKNTDSPLQAMVEKISNDPWKEMIVENDTNNAVIRQFDSPISDDSNFLGAVYALYDMVLDKSLKKEINKISQGDILFKQDSGYFDFNGTVIFSTDFNNPLNQDPNGNLLWKNQNILLSPLKGFENLYYSLSRENLVKEEKNLLLILGLFTICIVVISTGLSLFLGRQMSKPLEDMAAMALQISKGRKKLSFAIKKKDYLEFRQLSEAFNYMLKNLKEAEDKSRFTELLQNVDDAVYLTDESGKLLDANVATYGNLGYSHESFFRLTLTDILPLEDAHRVMDALIQNRPNQEPRISTLETCLVKNDKTTIPVEIKYRAIQYLQRRAILSVARDITRRIEAQRVLRESEELYRSLIETSLNGILILNDQFQMIYANNRLCQILGYSREEIGSVDFRDILKDSDLNSMAASFIEDKNDHGIRGPSEIKILRKDNDQRHCFLNTIAIADSSDKIRIVVQILDITDQFRAEQEKKLLESHLRQSQKMEAIGNLAGGIAHDFNNLLQIIHGYTEIMMMKKDKTHPDYQKLIEVKQTAQRATDLTKQLLTFSRKVESVIKPADLNHEVRQIHKLLERTLPHIINLELKLSDDLHSINADKSQLGQIIMNLSVNARDAMPNGGTMRIETRNVVIEEKSPETPEGFSLGPGVYAVLSISDTGVGMTRDSMDRIFEPFYTTKEVGKGTGLGLAIIYGIVSSHNGHISCTSEVGKGTTFDIYFPVFQMLLNA